MFWSILSGVAVSFILILTLIVLYQETALIKSQLWPLYILAAFLLFVLIGIIKYVFDVSRAILPRELREVFDEVVENLKKGGNENLVMIILRNQIPSIFNKILKEDGPDLDLAARISDIKARANNLWSLIYNNSSVSMVPTNRESISESIIIMYYSLGKSLVGYLGEAKRHYPPDWAGKLMSEFIGFFIDKLKFIELKNLANARKTASAFLSTCARCEDYKITLDSKINAFANIVRNKYGSI